jgi:hypothetical protein
MTDIRVNPEGVRRFLISTPSSGGRPLLRRQAQRLVNEMVAVARQNASGDVVNQRSGNLAISVYPIMRPRVSGGWTIGVGSDLPYARYLEEGTRPHTIRAIRRPYLRSAPGHPDPLRYPHLKAVNHPGNEPFRWLRKAVDYVMRHRRVDTRIGT